MAPRILLCGDVLGRLDQLYKRVSAVNKSNGPFDALFCVGQFFPLDDSNAEEVKAYLDGTKEVPVPTYFTGNYGHDASKLLAAASAKSIDLGLVSEPVSVCSSIFWLKGSGVFLLNDLRIAFLSGKADALVFENAKLAAEVGAFHQDDVDALRALSDDKQVIDLLLTNGWPQAVLRGICQPPGSEGIIGNPIISELASELKPRYHVAGTEGIFFAREPYSNEGVSHVTRFVALGIVGNDKKQKYLHALSPSPASSLSAEELAVTPPNTTPSPYQHLVYSGKEPSQKRFFSEITSTSNSEGQYWRYDTSSDAKKPKRVEGACFEFLSKGSCSRGEACKYKHTLDNGMPIPKKSCYDFLTKGSCERGAECRFHHAGEENTTSAGDNSVDDPPAGVCFHFANKGSCDKGDSCRFSHAFERKQPAACWFCLSSPTVETHLVVSVGDHCYCALAKGPLMEKHVLIVPIEHTPSAVTVSREVEKEVGMYKDALRRCFASQGANTLIFERYIHLRAGTHAHIQVVPISAAAATASLSAFETAANKLGFSFVTFPKGGNHVNELRRLLDGVNYFVVELPDGTILAHPCAAGEKMPMQFGREVIAGLLGTPEKSDWKSCKLSKDEETELVEVFKKEFQKFDPMQQSS